MIEVFLNFGSTRRGISEVLRGELAREAKFRICRSWAMSLAGASGEPTAGTVLCAPSGA